MANLIQGIYNYCMTFGPLVYLLVACAFVVDGCLLIFPSEETKNKAKKHLPSVMIGCGIILGATALATELSAKFVF